MNTTAQQNLAAAIAALISALIDISKPSSLIATAPVTPTHVHPVAAKPAKGIPVTVVAPVAKVAAPKPDKKTGLIDVSKLAGLVKARAVMANNRVIRARAEKEAIAA